MAGLINRYSFLENLDMFGLEWILDIPGTGFSDLLGVENWLN